MRRVHGRKPRRRAIFVAIIISVLGAVALATLLLNPHAYYERTHDLPNPYWALFTGSYTYTYTYDAGPPGPGLLDRRPDVAVLAYVRQYIAEFGSYPCHGQIGLYTAAHRPDTTCPPPVVGVEVTRTTVGKVDVGAEGQHGKPVAYVSLLVRYTDGTLTDRTIEMFPEDSTFYFLSWLHLNCWSSLETDSFYKTPDRKVPAGLSYYRVGEWTLNCHNWRRLAQV